MRDRAASRTPAPVNEEIRSLTALRFFAASGVALFHLQFDIQAPEIVGDIMGFARAGVDMFFVLSGFVLCHVYRRDFTSHTFNHGEFLWKRLARVYPVHLITLAIAVLLALLGLLGTGERAHEPEYILPTVLLVHAWGTTPELGWNYPSWSISAEWFAYLLFPLVMIFVTRSRRPVAILGCTMAGIAASYMVLDLLDRPFLHQTGGLSLLRIAGEFLLGVTLRICVQSAPRMTRVLAWLAIPVAVALAALHVASLGLIVLALIPLIVFELYRHPNWFAHPWLVYGGRISYSLYMVHALIAMFAMNMASQFAGHIVDQMPVWWLPLMFGLSLATAALLYHAVEVPARRWMTRLATKPHPPAQEFTTGGSSLAQIPPGQVVAPLATL